MPRSIATPMPPATRNASGAAISSDQSNSQGACVADHLLRHEGGVGAEHDQLAMRHVDHPHHPEGDGEPDRRQQQHRAERQPEPDVLQLAPTSPALRSISATAAVAAAAISGSSAACSGVSAASASLPPRPATIADRRHPLGRARRRTRAAPPPRASASACLTAGSLSAASAASDRRELLRVRACGTPRSPPPAAAPDPAAISVSVEIAERTARRSALLTLIGSVERDAHRPERRAGQRVEALGLRPAPGHPDHRAVRLARVQVALLQRLEHRRRPLVAGRADRGDHLGALAEAPLR